MIHRILGKVIGHFLDCHFIFLIYCGLLLIAATLMILKFESENGKRLTVFLLDMDMGPTLLCFLHGLLLYYSLKNKLKTKLKQNIKFKV